MQVYLWVTFNAAQMVDTLLSQQVYTHVSAIEWEMIWWHHGHLCIYLSATIVHLYSNTSVCTLSNEL